MNRIINNTCEHRFYFIKHKTVNSRAKTKFAKDEQDHVCCFFYAEHENR